MSTSWDVYSLHRFLQFKDKTVHCLRTQEHGEYVAVIFGCGNAEIHDLRKEKNKNLLRLRDVIDLCFLSIPVSFIKFDSNNTQKPKKYVNAVLVARQYGNSEFVRLEVFIEFNAEIGWIESTISVQWPSSKPNISAVGLILRGSGNIISMCSAGFRSIYVWRIAVNEADNLMFLSKPISINIGDKKQRIYTMILTKHALFASDRECVRISPAPSVLWNGCLQLKVAKICKLSVITSQLIAGINNKSELFLFGVDRKNQNFKAFFVSVLTPLKVAHCCAIPIGQASEAQIGKVGMGWNANKYLLCLKTPSYPQLFVVVLDSMFVANVLRSKETKRSLKITNYASSSKIICVPSNSLQIVPLYPDLILIPNQNNIHALLFTFK